MANTDVSYILYVLAKWILFNHAGNFSLKGLSHGQKCIRLFSDFEAYHEQ